MVAVVSIDPGAQLLTRSLGLKVVSKMGNAEQGGDHDDSPSWSGDFLDSNEKIVTINLRAPDLVVNKAHNRCKLCRCRGINPNSN